MRKDDEQQPMHISISGPVSGQVGIGQHITQSQNIGGQQQITTNEMTVLNQQFADLRSQVAAEAPSEQRDEALHQVDQLQQAITAPKPDVSTMVRVRDWFVTHLPMLAGTVLSVVVNPIVGKLVEAGGDMLADEFRQHFGHG
ncbi:MAG TPA: hypothetical protein VHV83_19910 [Armatimonadota bacterium]|nr:hypothetical protein [Armatimonadota bacterium]